MNFVPESKEKSREEEWKSVRDDNKSDDSEKSEDHRPLFERLKEQRAKRYEIVVGLDEDDADFLNATAKIKSDNKKKISDEDNAEIQEFRKKVRAMDVDRKEKTTTSSVDSNNNKSCSKFQNQKALMAGVKRKATEEEVKPTKKFIKRPSALKLMTILPGIPGISDLYSGDTSSDSNSSDEEIEKSKCGRDFIGRKIKRKSNNDDEHCE